jgi:hypothetical protein
MLALPSERTTTMSNTGLSPLARAADNLDTAARQLAHLPIESGQPIDTYFILGTLTAVQRRLTDIYTALAIWHASAIEGTHYLNDDGTPNDIETTANELRTAADLASVTEDALARAHNANGTIRWPDRLDI